jgi:hypothetical protein
MPALLLAGALAAAAPLPSLPALPFGTLEMTLEKTIFQVDVVRVEMRVDEAGAERLAPWAAGETYSEPLADSVAAVVLATRDIDIDLTFLHGASQKQFLNGIRDNLKRVVKAGWITAAHADTLRERLAAWYAFLEDRGVRDGDVMRYRIRGDTIRYHYTGDDGTVLLDFTGNDPSGRPSVLGSYLAPGSDFRRKLVSSLAEGGP